jgi:hypothetical protein
MRRKLRASTWGLAGMLMVTATACGQPAMTRADARNFARQALTHVGFTNVQVAPEVTAASYRSPDPRFRNQKSVAVWQTHSTVPEGAVDLYIPRKGNSAVFVRDEATAGGPLLTDRQFRLLRDFRLNPAADRRRDHLRGPTIAAIALAVIAASALFVAVLLGRAGRQGDGPPEPDPDTPTEQREPAGVM